MNATTSDPRFDFVSLGESMLRLTVPTGRRLEETPARPGVCWSRKRGGFVFNTIHNIMPDVPPENVVAMFEVVDEYR